jgi:hypothetical protein
MSQSESPSPNPSPERRGEPEGSSPNPSRVGRRVPFGQMGVGIPGENAYALRFRFPQIDTKYRRCYNQSTMKPAQRRRCRRAPITAEIWERASGVGTT